jgi:glutathione peroxidase
MTQLILVMFAFAQGASGVPAALDFTMNSIDGKPVQLSKYRGNVVLMVNVASECGYTPQYAGLQELHKRYASKGLRILGFPSNDFGSQEPGTNAEIAQFCQQNYGVQFDMFSKITVVGRSQHPLYKYLTAGTDLKFRGDVGWNFEKFLVGRNGQVLGRFKSPVEPLSGEMIKAIEDALASK